MRDVIPMVDQSRHIWQFGDSVPADRASRLLSYVSLDEIIGHLQMAEIVAFAWEPFQSDRLKGCHRVSFLLQVSPDMYDAFFNSPVGYRAQYAVGVVTGEAGNRALLRKFEPRLLEFTHEKNLVSETRVKASLQAADAKVWIYEPEVEAQLGREDTQILYAPWQQASTDGVGLLAPIGTKLEVKGGWVDDHGKERRDPFKANRSEEIHSVGYT